MGWKQWSAVAVVIGGGILLQIPGHDAAMSPAEMAAMSGSMDAPSSMYQTVALDVTGMT
jgi:hypothetical protein